MIRFALALGLALTTAVCLSGCAAVAFISTPPGAALAGASLGYLVSANNLADEALKVWDERRPVPALTAPAEPNQEKKP